MRKIKKQKKVNRKNFRFTDQITGMIEDTAERIGMSENELVSTAVFDVLSDRSKFIICPECKNFVAYKSVISISEGLGEFDCKCGAHIWYDFDTDKVLKHK